MRRRSPFEVAWETKFILAGLLIGCLTSAGNDKSPDYYDAAVHAVIIWFLITLVVWAGILLISSILGEPKEECEEEETEEHNEHVEEEPQSMADLLDEEPLVEPEGNQGLVDEQLSDDDLIFDDEPVAPPPPRRRSYDPKPRKIGGTEFYTFDEAIRVLGIKENKMKRLVSEGDIRAFRERDQMLFRKIELEMQCICKPEFKAECDATLASAIAHLKCKEEDLLDSVIVELSFEHDCSVSFGVDMWFGVFATSKEWTGFVPCDSLKHGLAALLMYCVREKAMKDIKGAAPPPG
jgi:hypothetical protein